MSTATIEKKIKAPKFVKDNTIWAHLKYRMYYEMGYIPPTSHKDYGLYKYGEYLAYYSL